MQSSTLALAVLLGAIACSQATPHLARVLTEEEWTANCGSQFGDLVKAAGLNDKLGDKERVYTIFVPQDKAFKPLRSVKLNVKDTKNLVKKHVIKGNFTRHDLEIVALTRGKFTTLDGNTLRITQTKANLKVRFQDKEYSIIGAMQAKNGYAYCVKGLLADLSSGRRRRSTPRVTTTTAANNARSTSESTSAASTSSTDSQTSTPSTTELDSTTSTSSTSSSTTTSSSVTL